MPKNALYMNADLTGVAEAIGTMKGVSAEVDTDFNVNTFIKSAWAEAGHDFDEFMDAVSRAEPKRYHHMYEWGMIGIPRGRLWKQKLRGLGRNRIATFEYRNSVRSVPRPKRSDVPSDQWELLSGKKYVFYAKAPVMESGLTVRIKAKDGGKIFIPFRNGEGQLDNEKGYLFADEAINTKPGGEVAGNFTNAWMGWWGTQSERTTAVVAKRFEEYIGKAGTPKSYAAINPIRTKRAVKPFSIMVDAADAKARLKYLEEIRAEAGRAEAFERGEV